MDLFKKFSMKMATGLDWNCKQVAKRSKGDTQRIHKQARRKIHQYDCKILEEWEGEN